MHAKIYGFFFLLIFYAFRHVLEQEKVAKTMGEVCVFFFRDLRFEIDSNVFLDHFWEDLGVENRSQIMKNQAKMMCKNILILRKLFDEFAWIWETILAV